jgi:hypothetical protein
MRSERKANRYLIVFASIIQTLQVGFAQTPQGEAANVNKL